jgi:hypothetical protein
VVRDFQRESEANMDKIKHEYGEFASFEGWVQMFEKGEKELGPQNTCGLEK